MPEAHNQFLVFPPVFEESVRLFDRFDRLEHFHGRLVGSAVQRSSQGSDRAGDAAVEVGSGGDCHSSREGGGVEVVLRVEDEGDVEGLDDERVKLVSLVVEFEEVDSDAVGGEGLDGDAFPAVAEVVPIVEGGSEDTHQAHGDGEVVVAGGFVRGGVLSGSRMPMTELMVRMTSMQFEVLGRASRTFFRV